MSIQVADNGGVRLAYETRGAGEPLLMIHGLGYDRLGCAPLVLNNVAQAAIGCELLVFEFVWHSRPRLCGVSSCLCGNAKYPLRTPRPLRFMV